MVKRNLLVLIFFLAVVNSEPDCSDEDIGMTLSVKL